MHKFRISNPSSSRYCPLINYRERLQKIVSGFKANFFGNGQVVIASFEAATNGRLAVTYYKELTGSAFINRLRYWDTSFPPSL